MKIYIRQYLAAALVLLLPAATAFGGSRNVRSGSSGSVNRPSGGGGGSANRNASSNNNVNRNNNTNVNRNTNVNSNTNVNRNTNVNVNRNVNVDVDVNHHGGYNNGCCYHDNHGIAAAAIVGTAIVTAAVIGTRVNTLPPSCTVIVANGVTYQQCGGAYYQPQFVGGNTTYVVVNSPY